MPRADSKRFDPDTDSSPETVVTTELGRISPGSSQPPLAMSHGVDDGQLEVPFVFPSIRKHSIHSDERTELGKLI